MNEITRISPISDQDAARMVRPGTLADLATQITASPVGGPPVTAPGRASERGSRTRRRALLALPLVAAVSAAVAFVAVNGNLAGAPTSHSQASSPGKTAATSPGNTAATPQAQALAFISSPGGGVTVIVRDPLAAPSVYQAEFARHHLDITLKIRPVSPSLVGAVIYMSEPGSGPQLVPITAKGACFTPGGGDKCPVGVKIPADFRGQAEIDFGRAARPGEQYVSTGSAFAPGEAMHGMSISGKTVAEVVAQLRARHVTVAYYNKQGSNGNVNVHSAPGGWYVYDAVPWAPGEVMLFVGPTPHPVSSGTPVGLTPVPSPTG